MKRTIYTAARIHAFNSSACDGNALLVENGRIGGIGSVGELRAQARDAEVFDFGSAVITPGLTDSHIHFTEWAVARSQVDLSAAHTMEEAARAVASAGTGTEWILGRGWNPHRWGGDYPTRELLDAVAPHHAVVLQSHDMHALWLNTRALERVGIAAGQADPDGGRILRDASGSATGVLLENAAQLVVPHLPRYDVAAMMPLVRAAQRQLHAYGITALHSFPGVHLIDPDPFTVLQAMREAGELRLRILQHIALDKLEHAVSVGLRSRFGDEWIRMGGVKMFLDGALGSRTAWMREPDEHSTDVGVQVMTESDFRTAVAHAAEHGIASVVHAIGDAAVQRAFEVLGAAPRCAIAHRIEHVQCLPRECAERLTQGVFCSVQPSHLMSDWRAADQHWGVRGRDTYAFRFMLDHGAAVVFGSDAPVEPADPRHGLYAAVTRADLSGEPAGGWYPEERVSQVEALRAYTITPQLLAGVPAGQTGLVPGALADIVAWRQDPLAVEPRQLLELTPAATVVGGEIVFGN